MLLYIKLQRPQPPNQLKHRWQKVSRLYGLRKTLWNKDKFCETMSSAIKGFEGQLPSEFVFPCWILPTEYKDLMTMAQSYHDKKKFILKPTDRGEGAGKLFFRVFLTLLFFYLF